jgi:hypothetical protein
VYSPQDYNDRLLLGLKGTMSEAELYWMRLRLQGGKLNKARRGEFHFRPPAGYVWDPGTARFRLDPDEHVQRAVRLVFERFRIDGSAYRVQRYFVCNGLQLPTHDRVTGGIRWVPPRPTQIGHMLHSPLYAGAYVWGRQEHRARLVNGQIRRHNRQRLPQEAWKVCLFDHHPAYIRWEEFMANQRKLDDNRFEAAPDRHGAPREGGALLQGLALCGRCGQRMYVEYVGARRSAQYRCRSLSAQGNRSVCWMAAAWPIDEIVAKNFLEAVQPPEIELGFAVVREAEKQSREVDQQWKLRLDRAQYEARLAERRYKAVDPENRVVARTLEVEWNERLRDVEAIENEHREVRRREKIELTDQDRARILALARDLPTVWSATTTTHADRKNLLRMLVEKVTLQPVDVPAPMTRVQVLWQTGAVSEWTVAAATQYGRTPDAILNLIRELAAELGDDRAIAAELNERGMATGRARRWTARMVQNHRYKHDIPLRDQRDRRADGLYSTHGIAARFEVSSGIVRYWVQKGLLTPAERGLRGRFLFKLDGATVSRLNAAKARGYGMNGRKQSNPRT